MIRYVIATVVMGLSLGGSATACQTYLNLPSSQIKESLSTIANPKTPDIDKLEAYETVSCVSDLQLRELVARQALAQGVASIVRSKALQGVLGSRKSFILKMAATGQLDRNTATFLERNHGSLTLHNHYYDAAAGCLTFGGSSISCYPREILQFRGTSVEISSGRNQIDGRLTLNDAGTELVGQVKYSRGPLLHARIGLFD